DTVLSGRRVEFEVEVPYESLGRHWMRCAYVPEVDEAGAVRGLIAVITDVTEHRQAEERFRLAVESAPNGVVMVNADGRIVLVNEQSEKMFGYSRGDLLGQAVDVLVPDRF